MMSLKRYAKVIGYFLKCMSESFEKYFIDDNSNNNYKSINNSFIKRI